ncbi:hypothetical protein BH11PLA2_BH11PLA2_30090 [soil metagenome]
MDGLPAELGRRHDVGKLLGYLNFSDGRPDPRFRRGLADAFGTLLEHHDATPWLTLGRWFLASCDDLATGGSAAFKDTTQARAIIAATFEQLPQVYREHHVDLLAHQTDEFLFTPFFLARCCEAALAARSADSSLSDDELATQAMGMLNDFVGYRPIAVLETRAQTDYYAHEKVCPVPVSLAGAGVAPGPYADLLRPALELLNGTDAAVCEEACFDLAKMDEVAIDPRAADHFHPINKRPNVLFGEWDPHRIDGRGFYRRFILKQPTLDALLRWARGGSDSGPLDHERLFESAAVLAGTILMGAGVSGSGPTYYDSTVTLSMLVQKIARYRDTFYRQLLDKLPGAHGERLRNEAAKLKQPFAAVRQSLNQSIAAERALHLQERRLALLFAAMGYPEAARMRAAKIAAPSMRFSCEIRIRQTDADFAAKAGHSETARSLLNEAEELLHRGIDCGALIDPWNILGYQGLFPIFPGREDTVRDPRAEELIYTLGRQFDRYAHALSAAATTGDDKLPKRLRKGMHKLADWWDRFATSTVNDLPRVVGGERATAAEHVSKALALWKQSATSARDVKFWQGHREGFKTPAAFAQVIEALLEAGDYKASLALIITWLSEASPELPLQDPAASFLRLAERWMSELTTSTTLPADEKPVLMRRFFELLEANADDRWHVPSLANLSTSRRPRNDDDEIDDEEDDDDTFSSAYDGMSYKDSADDGTEGSLADGDGPLPGEFALENDSEAFEDRLRFLMAVARLWCQAARSDLWPAAQAGTLGEWLTTAAGNHADLHRFINDLSRVEVPSPTSGVEGVMEFDRRRSLKGHLLDLAVHVAVMTGAAARRLAAALSRTAELTTDESLDMSEGLPGNSGTLAVEEDPELDHPLWEEVSVRLERAIGLGDTAQVRTLLAAFVPSFRHEPLLVHPPAEGGEPEAALRAQAALQLLEMLLTALPRLGCLRETFQLTKLARQMERNDPPEGRRISSFDQLFRIAVSGVVESVVVSSQKWPAKAPAAAALKQIADAFHRMWLDHSQSLRLSALETVLDDADWNELKKFIKTWGGDLFTVRFLTLSNIRGILGQGVTAWLDHQSDPDTINASETQPKLVDAWGEGDVDRGVTARLLEIVLQALVEHYDEYRDYNTTTTQSDYGDNIYILLDYLRLKAQYDRIAWRLRPMVLAHEVLCRRGRDEQAAEWREFISSKTATLADEILAKLSAKEAEHGLRLRTIRDRLEERFLAPLKIDQAAARVALAATAAKQHTGDTPRESDPAFVALLETITPLAATPLGVGLDVPAWLRRLEEELRKTRLGTDDDDAVKLALNFQPLTWAEVKKQLADWDKPIGD